MCHILEILSTYLCCAFFKLQSSENDSGCNTLTNREHIRLNLDSFSIYARNTYSYSIQNLYYNSFIDFGISESLQRGLLAKSHGRGWVLGTDL